MKTQVARNWKLGRTELQVTPQRGETLDVPGANWLHALHSELLLPADYDPNQARGKKLVLAYNITGLTALKRRVSRVWTQERYYTVLEGIERVCSECASGTRLIERILFDVEHIFLTESDEPRFIYVPLERLRFDSQAGATNAEHLRQFVLTKEVFSLNDFRSFLDVEFPALRQAARASEQARAAELDAARDARQSAFLDSLFAGFDAGGDAGGSEGEVTP